jgi:PleD family two-component response regulator
MKTILVIEADEQIRTYLLKILELKGYRLLEAEDGVTGVQIAKSYLPDLVICDSILPALDGDGVLTQLRQQAETTTIPVILIRAKADRAIVQQGVNLAADGYLTQPFTSAELLETVVAQLEKPVAILPYAQDIKQAAARLSNAAVCDPLFCDPLTNLPNRMMLRQRLQEVLQPQDQVDSAAAIAVLCLNFDRFQTVAISGDAIASKSFASGDALLQAAANRLVECISASEALHHHLFARPHWRR